ncbi:hypothetical protein LINPERPRIM_LOCUS19257 [Linum perenne]
MLDASSKLEVSRILALGKWRFGSISILADVWIKDAGRSVVSLEHGCAWFVASGIPIHLRSTDLFQKLGGFCGDFLGYELTSDLNSIRIKIRASHEVPDKVLLWLGEESFSVALRAETNPQLVPLSPKVSSEAVEDPLPLDLMST